jgi:hypothetical protein
VLKDNSTGRDTKQVADNEKVTDIAKVTDIVADKLTPGEKDFIVKLLPFFDSYEWISNSLASDLTSLAEGSVKRYLRNLTIKNVFEAKGEKKGRKYRLKVADIAKVADIVADNIQ